MKSFVKYKCEICSKEHYREELAIACERNCSNKQKCYHENILTYVEDEKIKAHCKDCGEWELDFVKLDEIEDEDWEALYHKYKN